ncbi:MAG TPA: HIT domain-containing protein [Roseiflexaceae bacterium]|jgi:ATP adenylyltransferase|nr:HIT domain-containing protein [Roseiflexaceae bacterium]
MEIQFTPWRMAYIKSDNSSATNECVLCRLGREEPGVENLVLFRGTSCYVVMNRYPYNTGHLMVAPYEHTSDLPGLAPEVAEELFDLTRRCITLVGQAMQPDGFNMGMNLGKAAGAGIDEHLHMHVVPRWGGDMNFMPIIGGVKLIPEALDQTYAHLYPLFAALKE